MLQKSSWPRLSNRQPSPRPGLRAWANPTPGEPLPQLLSSWCTGNHTLWIWGLGAHLGTNIITSGGKCQVRPKGGYLKGTGPRPKCGVMSEHKVLNVYYSFLLALPWWRTRYWSLCTREKTRMDYGRWLCTESQPRGGTMSLRFE